MVSPVAAPVAPLTKDAEVAPGEAPAVEGAVLRSLCAHLRAVADKRSPHGKVHALHAVLCLVVVTLLVGKVGLSCAIAFAMGHGARRRYNGANHERHRRETSPGPRPSPWLYEIGLLWRGVPTVPSLPGLIHILAGVTPADLQEALTPWVAETLETLRAARYVASADGKAMKAGGRHVLSVFVHDFALVALHEEVAEKKNELSTLRDRLDWLLERYPGLWLLCGDAMFADTTLCELLNRNGRDWLFQIKANQPALREKLEVAFSPMVCQAPHASAEPEKKGSTWKNAITGSCPGTVKS